jgi:tetratricopeptide (TPR) repeat protein
MLQKQKFRPVIAILFFTTQLLGCTTFADVKQNRNIPFVYSASISKGQFNFDGEIRGYRVNSVPDYRQQSQVGGKIIRTTIGKKIQTKRELSNFLTLSEHEDLGLGQKAALFGTGATFLVTYIVFLPITLGFDVVKGILNLTFQPVTSSLQSQYKHNAENAYISGRYNFDSGKTDMALADWEKAEDFMPSLKAFSDIDYWRGRAFEMRHQPKEALTAYEEFLSFSESSVPAYFKNKYSNDVTWGGKAEDVDMRIPLILKDIDISVKESHFLFQGDLSIQNEPLE